MAGMPLNFAIPGESAVASYNWSDLANGLGYQRLYLFNLASDDKNIAPTNFYGSTSYHLISNSASNTKVMSSIFNFPRIVRGNAFISFFANSDTSSTQYRTVTVKLQKYNGTDYTDISSSTSIVNYFGSGSNPFYFCGKVIITETTIKKGEYLVLNVSTDSMTSVRNNSAATPAFMDIPFKIDL